MLKIDRKIFAAEMQIGMVGAIPGLGCHLAGEIGPAGVVDQRRRAGVPEDVNLRAKGAGETGGNLADPGLDPLLHFTAVGAQRPLQLDALRQHVPGIASLDPRHAEHHRVEGVHFPAGHALQHRHQLAGQQDRILSFMWAGGMRPLPGHFEDEAVDVGVERAAAGGKFAHRQAGLIVHTKDRRHVLQRPGADQGFRAAKIFLRRLKQDPHPPREFRFPLLQQQRRPQHHAGVNIVAAGMHYPLILRAVRQTGRLLDGQRVDVRPQGNHLVAAADFGDQPGFQIVGQQGQPAALQPVADPRGGGYLLQGELRVLVQLAPPANQLLFKGHSAPPCRSEPAPAGAGSAGALARR